MVLVSASNFLSTNTQVITRVKTRLDYMFENPHKHLVIGITQSRLTIPEAFEDEEEILNKAMGSKDELISFRDY